MATIGNEVQYQLKNLTLTGLEFSPGKSKPVIISLHGWLDNAASFIPLAEYLPDYHIVAIDLVGHGKSSHRCAGAHYHLVDNVQDIHELVTLNDWQEIYFVCHSMGGIIASMYAACFPEIVKKLVLIESFGPLTMDPQTSAEQLRESVLSRIASEDKAQRHPDSLSSAVTARMIAGKMNEASATLLMQRNINETNEGLRWRTDRRLRTLSSLRLIEEQANNFLQNINAPTLCILGTEGFEKLKVNVARRASLVKNLTQNEVVGGHHVHMDNPQDTANCVTAFLEKG